MQKNYFKKIKNKRDIYYIILDAHASSYALKKYHGYDNSWFINALEERGFFLPRKTFSNYPVTVLSIPSSLNMEYHTKLFKNSDITFGLAYEKLKNNNVEYFLNKLGYKIINTSYSWGPTSKINSNQILRNLFFGEFNQGFFYLIFTRFVFNWLYNYIKSKDHLQQLSVVKNNVLLNGPKFVFSHFLCPHRPFVFKRDGSLRLNYDISNEAYIDQLYYIDKMILDLIDSILNMSKLEPIIVLQADHGSHGNLFSPRILAKINRKDFKYLSYSMFNAFYLPGIKKDDLPENISPVNNFRLIFNKYFGTDFKILENKQIG